MDDAITPPSGVGRRMMTMVAYVAASGLALLVSLLPFESTESFCGPWGCFPPLQALAAIHLLWGVVATPNGARAVGPVWGDAAIRGSHAHGPRPFRGRRVRGDGPSPWAEFCLVRNRWALAA